jgi:hypothetical protein
MSRTFLHPDNARAKNRMVKNELLKNIFMVTQFVFKNLL